MPNQISGKDGTGASQVPFVGTDGSLKVASIPGGGVQAVSGSILSNGIRIKATPTMSGATYTAGLLIGTKMVLSGATRIAGSLSLIESVVLTDKAKQSAVVNIVFFEANPSSSTFSDHVALTVNDVDLLNIAGTIQIAATDWVNFADNGVASKLGLGFEFQSADSNLYAAILVNSGTPTFASASDMQLSVALLHLN